jgi:hypothetical protein
LPWQWVPCLLLDRSNYWQTWFVIVLAYEI